MAVVAKPIAAPPADRVQAGPTFHVKNSMANVEGGSPGAVIIEGG